MGFRSINARLVVVVHGAAPGAVDDDGLLNTTQGSYEPGELPWVIPAFTRDDPQTAQVFEQADGRGELWLITGSVPAYCGPVPHTRTRHPETIMN